MVYRRLLDLLRSSVWISLMKIKMILIKRSKFTTTTTTETFKCHKKSTLYDAQNAGNHISELLDFHFFPEAGGACPQTPLGENGLAAPLVVTATYYTVSGRL